MTEYIRITDSTLHWFSPLLSNENINLLKNSNSVYAIGAVFNKTACGVLLFDVEDITANILYIAVSDGFKRKGIASGMINYLCNHAYETTTPIICTFASPNKNDPIYLLFAENEHFSVSIQDGFFCRVPLNSLSNNNKLAPLKDKLHMQQFFSLPTHIRQKFFSSLRQNNDMLMYSIDEEDFYTPLCLCSTSNDTINSAIFVSKRGDDFELCYAWCASGYHQHLMCLLSEAWSNIPKTDGFLYISAVNHSSIAIVNKLIPQREIIANYYEASWDMEV